jgi:competence protein ComEC
LRLSRRKAFWAILACIWLYTLFVGATPTVIRAAVMGTIMVVGQRLERPAFAWTTLFAAGWAMTVWDPQTLWDMGFQLSALATASLFAFGKGTEALLLRTPLRLGWLDWARAALTAAVQLPSFPLWLLLAYYAIVVGSWLWSQRAAGAGLESGAHPLYVPEQLT